MRRFAAGAAALLLSACLAPGVLAAEAAGPAPVVGAAQPGQPEAKQDVKQGGADVKGDAADTPKPQADVKAQPGDAAAVAKDAVKDGVTKKADVAGNAAKKKNGVKELTGDRRERHKGTAGLHRDQLPRRAVQQGFQTTKPQRHSDSFGLQRDHKKKRRGAWGSNSEF